ncbi:hypothetical protein [uncultured Bacteroides sp.]|uniref:hypothetical protein n=1 Tax=uncultured Bacteroides sp. TaxID=162156 RepID=UPI0025F9C55B|nr:hypothetical protein [uncultured Bacteroides sp.]
MDENYFYNNYGQIIAEIQSKNNRIGQWPYIIPDSTQNIPIDDDNIRNKFRSNSIVYSFGGPVGVIYKEGFITFGIITQYMDAISYEFSGCYMAKFFFRGNWYVCHISCKDGALSDCKDVWTEFTYRYQKEIKHLFLFNPIDYDIVRQITIKCNGGLNTSNRFQVCGLITSCNRMYSLCFDTLTGMCERTIVEHQNKRYSSIPHFI